MNEIAADIPPASIKVTNDDFSNVAEDKPLWLEIVRFLDDKTLDKIDRIPELEGMTDLVKAERETARAVIEFRNDIDSNGLDIGYSERNKQRLLRQVEEKRDFWSSTRMRWTKSNQKPKFEELFRHAGVNPATCPTQDGPCIWFLSEDAKVLICCVGDPRNDRYCYFGIFGKRERVEWLDEWLEENKEGIFG